jgi:hypothetical protein
MSNLSPKVAIPRLMLIVADKWYSTYNTYVRDLDRVDGKLLWTEEEIRILNMIHDDLINYLLTEIEFIDLDVRLDGTK